MTEPLTLGESFPATLKATRRCAALIEALPDAPPVFYEIQLLLIVHQSILPVIQQFITWPENVDTNQSASLSVQDVLISMTQLVVSYCELEEALEGWSRLMYVEEDEQATRTADLLYRKLVERTTALRLLRSILSCDTENDVRNLVTALRAHVEQQLKDDLDVANRIHRLEVPKEFLYNQVPGTFKDLMVDPDADEQDWILVDSDPEPDGQIAAEALDDLLALDLTESSLRISGSETSTSAANNVNLNGGTPLTADLELGQLSRPSSLVLPINDEEIQRFAGSSTLVTSKSPSSLDYAEPSATGHDDPTRRLRVHHIPAALQRRLEAEIRNQNVDGPLGVSCGPKDGDLRNWQGIIIGPRNTPYEGGIFSLDIQIPDDYPARPPSITFETKIYHPNVTFDGEVLIDVLKAGWCPALTISTVLLSIQSILDDHSPDVTVPNAISEVYENDPAEYDSIAREWTQAYAM